MDRYFSESPIAAEHVTLGGPEAHHLIHVMRCRPGLRVVLFDGLGGEYAATVTRVGRSEVELAVEPRREVDRELPFSLTLAVALPKGDRQKWLVEKLVELGVTRLVPLVTARSVAQPVAGALERLRRGVIEASKQCGRNRLMEIAPPADGSEFLATASVAAVRLLSHPDTTNLADSGWHAPERSEGRGVPRAIIAAVGPEGGFADEEVAAARAAGWQPVALGRRILRVETAAIYLAAVLSAGGTDVTVASGP